MTRPSRSPSEFSREEIERGWLAAIETAQAKKIDEVPDGWVTMEAFAKIVNKGVRHARDLMRELLEEGSADQQHFRIRSGGHIRQVPHYCLKK